MPVLDQSFRSIISRVYLNAGSELDAMHAEVLRNRVHRALDQTTEMVMLVCTQVQFVDTGGLRMLLEMERVAQSRGIRLVIVNPSRPLRELLTLTGLTDAIDIDDQARPAPDAEHHPANGSPLHGFPVPDLPTRHRSAEQIGA
jgi:anti-anti-sigma factor